ncbi:uncharacterized protein LOC128198677 [Bicyclus anynana]|uniref:Uncharacterized protein LOC128198677 n=1 Tax=Bicyclus anynana TaxID=110368 RepID=A0ABM3LPQ3_BICAN|nr:uncharacterized protein LOC128198677 [Bicyclus anynana]
MFVLKLVLVACAVLVKCDAAFVDTLTKCSIQNDECLSNFYESSLRKIGSVGIPEINMPPIDPYKITNVTVKVLDVVTVTMTDGVLRGLSKCKSLKYHMDLKKRTVVQEFVCNLSIIGNIVIEGSSPAVQGIFGAPSIDGVGTGKVKLEKLFFRFDFPLIPFKKEDGEVYFKILNKNIKYKYDVKKVIFEAEKLMVGSEDISKVVIPYLNNNYEIMLQIIGPEFFKKGKDIFVDVYNMFIGRISTKNYLSENLSYLVD